MFTPFTLKGLQLPNRIVMVPMTHGMAKAGIPGPEMRNIIVVARKATNVRLVLTEGTVVNRPVSRKYGRHPFFLR
ncbi:MAG: hypothetical protein ACR5LD_08335 [Symbiopectobacterium sp.]